MARKKIEDKGYRYESWQEVDGGLRQLCIHTREAELISQALNERIDAEKSRAEAELRPIRAEMERIESGIKDFAQAHREDMGGLKSRKLNFGTVFFLQKVDEAESAGGTREAGKDNRVPAQAGHEGLHKYARTKGKQGSAEGIQPGNNS